jgi:diguanylate cyclase (GGDEF)-like protein
MRESDSIVRWGGEEFLGIARGLNPAEATVLAERIRSFVAAHPYEIAPGLTITVTCSVGFAVFPIFADQPDALPWERAIELADECLYEAKRSGRNRWVGLLAKPGAAAPVSSDHLPHARALADAGLVTWVQLEP